MGEAREGYDLFNKWGRRHFIRDLKAGRFNSYVWRDTFGRFACRVLGHDVYDSNPGGTPEPACKRCCKFLRM